MPFHLGVRDLVTCLPVCVRDHYCPFLMTAPTQA